MQETGRMWRLVTEWFNVQRRGDAVLASAGVALHQNVTMSATYGDGVATDTQ